MRTVLLGLLLMLGLLIPAQVHADDEFVAHRLGETEITIWVFTNGPGLAMFAPHDDENISAAVAMLHVAEHGGTLVQFVQNGKRNITFSLGGRDYAFDPNRMFTDVGIEASLKAQGKSFSAEAFEAVKALSKTVLGYLGSNLKKGQPLVALHNNTNGNYSLESYLKGGNYAGDALKVYQNSQMDPDDFCFVTDERIFGVLQASGVSVVLQNNAQVTNDGSLSVYAARAQVPYINIEAQEDGAMGHEQVQASIVKILQKAFP